MTETTPAMPNDPQQRVADLATGFALNELTDDELRELHRHLLAPDSGREAARTAWRTLDTITDLRAERSTLLQDTVTSRIAETAGSSAGSVTGRFLRRLGLRRGGLEPVATTSDTSFARNRWTLISAGLLVVGVAVGSWLMLQPATVAVVETVRGRVTAGRLGLGPHTAVEATPVMLAVESALGLRWPQGTTVQLAGPATLVPQANGLALPHGHAEVATSTPFVIGLPDGSLSITADSRVVVETSDGHSAIGILAGRARIDQQELSEGQAWAGGKSSPWSTTVLSRMPARWDPPTLAVWHLWLQTDSGAAGEITLAWSDAQVRILRTGIQVTHLGGGGLRTVRPPAPAELHLAVSTNGWQLILAGETLLRGEGSPGIMTTEIIAGAKLSARLQVGPLRP